MRIIILALLTISAIVFGCSKSDSEPPKDSQQTPEVPNTENPDPEQPQTEVYFTLNVLGQRDETVTDEWILIHNEEGTLLGFENYNVGDMLQFEAPVTELGNFISITEFKYTLADNGARYFSLRTSTKVPVGSEWTFESPPELPESGPQPEPTGTFDLEITNIPVMRKINVSTKRVRQYTSLGSTPEGLLYTFSGNFNTYEGEDEYIISILDGSNSLKYYSLINPDGNNTSIDYSEFVAYDHYISVDLPSYNQYYLNVAAFEEDEPFWNFGGFWLHDIIYNLDSTISTSPLVFGYLDRFSRYRTIFSLVTDDFTYNVVNYGAPLENLTIPDNPQFTLLNGDPWNFDYSVDLDYLSADFGWGYKIGVPSDGADYQTVSWTVNAEKGYAFMLGELPEDVLAAYPQLQTDMFEYKSTRFYLPIEPSEYLAQHELTIYQP